MSAIVDSVVYRDGKRIRDIAIDAIGEVMQQAGTLVWLGMHEPDDSQLLRIQHVFGLHELAIEDAHHAHQRPKIEAYSNSLFIVLKTGLPKGPGFALYAVLDFVADNYQPVVAQFEADFDAIESDIFKDQFDRPVIERLYALKRHLLELRNAALPLAEISSELMRLHEDLIPKDCGPTSATFRTMSPDW